MAEKNVAAGLLMPKATAVWLIENTALSFKQIADFTGLHEVEIDALANEEVGRGIVGRDPIENNELLPVELEKAQQDETYQMKLIKTDLPAVHARAKGPRYTPVSKRADKPDAIAYILKHHPEISEAQICRLIGTTKPTVEAIRTRSHPNSANLRPRHPVDLGMCTYAEMEAAIRKGLKAAGKNPDEILSQKSRAFENMEREEDAAPRQKEPVGFDFSNFLSKTSSGGQN